jgi:hypothetical protein
MNALRKFKQSSRDSKHKERHADGSQSTGATQRMQPQRMPDMDAFLFQFNNVTLSLEQGNLHNFKVNVFLHEMSCIIQNLHECI